MRTRKKNNERDTMVRRVSKQELQHRELIEKLESIQKNTSNEEISLKINDLQTKIKELIMESTRSLGLAYVSVAFAFISIGISVILRVLSVPDIGYWIIGTVYIFAGAYVLYFVKEFAEKYNKLKREKH